MNELGYLEAIVLGVVQGITEFLPISSSAHLAVVQRWMGLPPESLTLLLFDLMTHVGTVISILIVFARPLKSYLVRLIAECSSGWTKRRYATRILLLGVTASIPTAAIGLGFKDFLEAAFGHPRRIGGELVVTGLLLIALTFVSRGRRGWKNFRFSHAVWIGIAQGVSILPGISRSGATICTASFFGIRRRWATEFSFYIAIPAILGAAAIKLNDAFKMGGAALAELPWGPMAAGSIVALVVGVVSLMALVQAVRRAKLHYFAYYCWVVGGLILLGKL